MTTLKLYGYTVRPIRLENNVLRQPLVHSRWLKGMCATFDSTLSPIQSWEPRNAHAFGQTLTQTYYCPKDFLYAYVSLVSA